MKVHQKREQEVELPSSLKRRNYSNIK